MTQKGVMQLKRISTSLLALVLLSVSISAQLPLPSDEFYQTIRRDDLPALRALVAAHGADVNDNAGQTPLMLAAAFGSSEAVRVLVERGADVKAQSGAGLTALH